jgi:hypothetical protein
MKSIKRHITLPALAITALTIVSCGGGGGDGGGTSSNPISLTASNAKPVSAEILDSSDTVQGTTAGPAILTRGAVNPEASDFNFPEFVVQQLAQVQALGTPPNTTLAGAIISPYTYSCTSSGQFTLSGNDADGSGDLTAGDSVTLAFASCIESGVSVNGSISMTITQLTGDIINAPYTLGVDVTLTNLSVSVSGHSATSNGDMSMLIAEDGSQNQTFELSGNSLTSWVLGQRETLTNYLYEFALNDVTGAYTFSLQGTFANTTIGGSVTYTTVTPFTGTDPNDPTAGELHIVGSGGSQAWLTADPGGSVVYIDVDADGDGTAETQITTSWAELDSL